MNRPNITRPAIRTQGYLAAALLLCTLAALAACTATDDPVPSGAGIPLLEIRAGIPLLEIRAGIDAPLTRASGTTWAPGDAIGISSRNTGGDVRSNIKYITPKGDGVFIPAHPDTVIVIRPGANLATTLYAYYPFTGKNGALSLSSGIKHTIMPDDQAPDRQSRIDYLFAEGTSYQPTCVMQFRHKMSRITLNFVADGLDRLGDMTCTLGPLKTAGSFDPTTGDAAADIMGDAQPFSILLPSGTTTASLLFYPQELASIPFSIEMNGETYNTFGLPISDLESGKEYVFTIKVSDRRVTVSASTSGSWSHQEATENITSNPL